MKKFLLSILIGFSLLSASQVSAWVETDNYCENGQFGLSDVDYNPLFQVNYGAEKKSVYEALRIHFWQRWVGEGTWMLYYAIQGDTWYEIYQYNCRTHKPKKIADITKHEQESLWIATYSERYIVFATSYFWLSDHDAMDSIYIYDMLTHKMVVKIPNAKSNNNYGYNFAHTVYKSKKGTFILSLIGDHPKLVRYTSVIEINPKTWKITEL